jgi:hypothetical protein
MNESERSSEAAQRRLFQELLNSERRFRELADPIRRLHGLRDRMAALCISTPARPSIPACSWSN